jgi:beta-barrel assembly-enhancing protease
MSMPSSTGLQPFGRNAAGRYGDGKSAASHDAIVAFGRTGLELTIDGQPGPVWPYADLRAATPLGMASHNVLLSPKTDPDATLFVADMGFCRALLETAPHLGTSAERWRVLKPALAVGAVAFSLGLTAWIFDVSPSKSVAQLIPDKVRNALGASVVDGMVGDRKVCREQAGLDALGRLHRKLQPKLEIKPDRILVVDWGLVNAFAVPGGQVVITRAILEKASSADEVAGVIGHEIGHGLALHPETGLVRGIGFWAVLQFFMTGSPGVLGNLGATAMQFSYSRDAEREADQYAINLLRDAGISVKPFAAFFKKIDPLGKSGTTPPPTPTGRVGSVFDILSTHPAPAERVAKIEAVPDYPSSPALSEVDWKALQAICGIKPKVEPKTATPPATKL